MCVGICNFLIEEVGGDYPLLVIVFSHRALPFGNMCEKYDILKAKNCCITGTIFCSTTLTKSGLISYGIFFVGEGKQSIVGNTVCEIQCP